VLNNIKGLYVTVWFYISVLLTVYGYYGETLTPDAPGSGWWNLRRGGGDGVPAFCAITNPEMSLVPSTDSIVSRNAVSLFCEPMSCREWTDNG